MIFVNCTWYSALKLHFKTHSFAIQHAFTTPIESFLWPKDLIDTTPQSLEWETFPICFLKLIFLFRWFRWLRVAKYFEQCEKCPPVLWKIYCSIITSFSCIFTLSFRNTLHAQPCLSQSNQSHNARAEKENNLIETI